jgi:nitroimidazol reductase NimA-like FMN-containing flavoprotein (pyridoxamine 5'-phosphate oxidase superfamily)
MHSAQVGRTRANVDNHPKVCFTATTMGRILPADEALEFSVEYQGVVVFGTSEIIEDNDEKRYGLQLLLDKYAPHLRPDRDYRGITNAELNRTAVYRINIEEWSGKVKSVADDFPGAFFYDPTPDSAD